MCVQRTMRIYDSFTEAEETQTREDEALTPAERLRTTFELSVMAHGPPAPMVRVLRIVETSSGILEP